MTFDLTPKQKEVYDRLPDSRRNIAEDLDISIRSVRYRMEAMEEEGVEFTRNENGIWYVGLREDVPERNEGAVRVNTYDKAQVTKDVNNTLTEIEKEMKEAVNNVSPFRTKFDNETGKSTLVIPRTDDHFGCRVIDRSVNSEYTTEIAVERINYIIDKAIETAKDRGDVEDVILGLFGDHVDGENVYPGHSANVEKFLRDQIREASTTYIEQIQKLSEEFENVKVVTCPGNHGNIGSITNADDIIFDQIEVGLQYLDIDNVEVIESNGQYVNFDIRGHRGYARHGSSALQHASTSSGDDRWMNWKEDSPFDVAYHGHHHQLRMEPVGHSQLFQCGTPVPPSLFVDSIGATGIPRVFFHFATDENPVEQIETIDFL